jgi:hypothetical protein
MELAEKTGMNILGKKNEIYDVSAELVREFGEVGTKKQK